MATGLHIKNGITFDGFTNQVSSSYALSYDPTTGLVGYMGTGSFTTGYLTLDNTGSFVTNAMTASMLSPYTLNSQTSSFVLNTQTGSFLTTGSSGTTQSASGSLTITQNLTVLGTASFQYVNVIYETASVIYSSGSNQFGDATNDTQTLIGTTKISGSLEVTGSTYLPNLSYAVKNRIVVQDVSTGQLSYQSPADLTIFPYTGSAAISGALSVTGSVNILLHTGAYADLIGPNSFTVQSMGTNNTYINLNTGSITLGSTRTGNHITISGNSNLTLFSQIAKFISKIAIATGTAYDETTSSTNRLNVKGYGTGSSVNTIFVNSNNRELFKVLDNGQTYVSGTLNVTGSTVLSGSIYINGILNDYQNNILTYNTSTGQVYYTASNSIIPSIIGQDGYIPLFSGTTQLTSSAIQQSGSTSIGINLKPNLSYSLDVSGSIRTNDTVYLAFSPQTQQGLSKYAFANSGSTNTGMFYYAPTVMIFDVSGQNVLKITNTKNVTNVPIEFGTVTNAGNITYASQTLGGLILNAGSSGSAIYTPSGSVVIGPIGFTTGSKLNVAGDTFISGTLATSGSVVFKTISNTSATNYLSYDSVTGQVYYSATSSIVTPPTFPYTGNAVISGSLTVSGSGITLTGSLGINGSLTEHIVTGSLGSGTTTVFQRATGSYTSALAKYTVNKSTNARAGEFMTVWNENEIVNADISTTDIGSTAEVGFTSSLVNGQIQTNIVTSTSGWTAKMLITYL